LPDTQGGFQSVAGIAAPSRCVKMLCTELM